MKQRTFWVSLFFLVYTLNGLAGPTATDRIVGWQIGDAPWPHEFTFLQGTATTLQAYTVMMRADGQTHHVPGIPAGYRPHSKNQRVLRILGDNTGTGKISVFAESPGTTTVFLVKSSGKLTLPFTILGNYTVVAPGELRSFQDSAAVIYANEFSRPDTALVVHALFVRSFRGKSGEAVRLRLKVTEPSEITSPPFPDIYLGRNIFDEGEDVQVFAGYIPQNAARGPYRIEALLLDGDAVVANSRFNVFVGEYGYGGALGEPRVTESFLSTNQYGQPIVLIINSNYFPARLNDNVLVFMDGVLISRDRRRNYVERHDRFAVNVNVEGMKFPVARHKFVLFFLDTGISVSADNIMPNPLDPNEFEPFTF